MNEFYTRSLSGFLYIVLLIGAIFFSPYTFLFLFLLFGYICLLELQRLIHFKNPVLPLILIIGYVLLHLYKPLPILILIILLAATLVTDAFLIRDLLTIRIIPVFEKRKYIISIFYLITSFICLTLIPFVFEAYQPMIILGCFILIWTNDSFAFLIGKQFGKNKLFERVSPKKTIEGFLGGMIFTLIAGFVLSIFTDALSPPVWLLISLIISIFGTLGDLIQSRLKRQAGVKDSGNIMPGHGGLFDRLDSIIFAGPFIYTLLQITHYVS